MDRRPNLGVQPRFRMTGDECGYRCQRAILGGNEALPANTHRNPGATSVLRREAPGLPRPTLPPTPLPQAAPPPHAPNLGAHHAGFPANKGGGKWPTTQPQPQPRGGRGRSSGASPPPLHTPPAVNQSWTNAPGSRGPSILTPSLCKAQEKQTRAPHEATKDSAAAGSTSLLTSLCSPAPRGCSAAAFCGQTGSAGHRDAQRAGDDHPRPARSLRMCERGRWLGLVARKPIGKAA